MKMGLRKRQFQGPIPRLMTSFSRESHNNTTLQQHLTTVMIIQMKKLNIENGAKANVMITQGSGRIAYQEYENTGIDYECRDRRVMMRLSIDSAPNLREV